METGSVHSEGADIVYDVEGSGPLLLMIAGRGGTGGRYAGVSARLQEEYRVVRYDRRCCGRSTGDRSRPMELTQQARDALAILGALGETRGCFFGNSAGASIAVRVAEYFPEAVLGMIVHEPMIVSILPDREQWIEFHRKVDHTFRTEGAGLAMGLLAGSMVGLERPGDAGPRKRPDEDMGFFLENEMMSLCYYRPDLERIRRNRVDLLATKGELSRDAYYARTADAFADAAGCPVRALPGNHIAHVLDPAAFASALRTALADLQGGAAAGVSFTHTSGADHVGRT